LLVTKASLCLPPVSPPPVFGLHEAKTSTQARMQKLRRLGEHVLWLHLISSLVGLNCQMSDML
jgi:hypothetical protein